MKDPLDDALGLPPMPRPARDVIIPEEGTAVDKDYEHARQNLYRLISKAEDHLDELGEIAMISQHARAYEVYANLMKTTIDANKDLLELAKAQKTLSGVEGPKTVNQNLIMTSDEVLKMLKGNK